MNLHQLLAVMGHELRTPLAAILGYNELLSDGIYGQITDRQREPLARIQHSAVQLVRLLDGVSDLVAGGEAHRSPGAPVKLSEILDRVLDEVAEIAISRGTTLHHEPWIDSTLHTDPDRLMRALEMLVTAAIKASPGGSLALRSARNNGHVVVAVAGSALDPDRDAPDLTRDAAFSGSAFRLAIAREAARILGGELELADGEVRISVPEKEEPKGE